jgi:hypothetical protein
MTVREFDAGTCSPPSRRRPCCVANGSVVDNQKSHIAFLFQNPILFVCRQIFWQIGRVTPTSLTALAALSTSHGLLFWGNKKNLKSPQCTSSETRRSLLMGGRRSLGRAGTLERTRYHI